MIRHAMEAAFAEWAEGERLREDFAPCYAFGMPRGGSTLMERILRALAARAEVAFLPVDDLINKVGILRDNLPPETAALLHRPGIIYGGLRRRPPALKGGAFDAARKVVLLRDIRDVLVSNYFFTLHGSQQALLASEVSQEALESLEATRRYAAEAGIDDYVLSVAVHYREVLEGLRPLLGDPNTKVFRYEDVIFDKPGWAEAMSAHFRLDLSPQACAEEVAPFDVFPKGDDPGAHMRKAIPGDHKGRLKPTTLAALAAQFGPLLSPFGYQFDSEVA